MNRPPEVTDEFRDDHDWIIRVMNVLERVAERAEEDGSLDMEAAEECVRFIRLFADACHHGKEEDLLFTELESTGMSREHGPIAVMLHEHAEGRKYARLMTAALKEERGGHGAVTSAFIRAARGYIALMRRHILKENHILFDVADQLVTGARCTRLCEGYQQVCSGGFEGHTVGDLRRLAEKLERRYPRPRQSVGSSSAGGEA